MKKNRKGIDESVDDGLCKRCGLCCRIKHYHRDLNLWTVTDQYCPFFEWIDLDGKRVGNCKIYRTKRHSQLVMARVRCIDAKDLVTAGLQPESCPYTKKVKGYRCRVIGFDS